MITNNNNNKIELIADKGKLLYNTTELCRNFVHAVTLGCNESVSNWIECTDKEKVIYEEEQERLLGKDTDNAEGSMSNPIQYNETDYVEEGKWYLHNEFGLIECIKSGVPTTDNVNEYFDLPPM